MKNQTPDDRFGKHYNKFWNKQMKDPEFKKEYDKLSADDRFDEKFYNVGDGVGGRWLNGTPDEIKSFLHSEIDLARAEMVEPGAVIRAIDEVRNETLEQAAKAVESMIFDNEGNTKNGTAPSILINPHKYADLQTWNYVLTSAADIIRKLKNK